MSIKKSIKENRALEEHKVERKRLLGLRKKLTCSCKKTKSQEKVRSKYGVGYCDAFSLHYSMPIIISNSLFQFLSDAKSAIQEHEKGEWKTIEKHALAIQAYADYDGLTAMAGDNKERFAMREKELAWREAMHYLTENMQGLWW